MPFRQASLAVPHRLLVLRHEGRSFISSLAFRYRKTRSRFYTACAASPAQHVLRAQARRSTNRPELQFELATDCAGLPAQAFGALCPLRRATS